MSLLEAIRPSKREEAAPPSHIGIMHIGGVIKPVQWDTADPVSVARAEKQFDRAIRSGYTGQAYGAAIVTPGMGYSGEVTREFRPEADEIRLTLPYAGG